MPRDVDHHGPRDCVETFFSEAITGMSTLDDERVHLLRSPHQELKVELPLRRVDGSVQIFHGYRVQHNNARGPFKGGLRYHPIVDMDEFRGLAALITLPPWREAVRGHWLQRRSRRRKRGCPRDE